MARLEDIRAGFQIKGVAGDKLFRKFGRTAKTTYLRWSALQTLSFGDGKRQ